MTKLYTLKKLLPVKIIAIAKHVFFVSCRESFSIAAEYSSVIRKLFLIKDTKGVAVTRVIYSNYMLMKLQENSNARKILCLKL